MDHLAEMIEIQQIEREREFDNQNPLHLAMRAYLSHLSYLSLGQINEVLRCTVAEVMDGS